MLEAGDLPPPESYVPGFHQLLLHGDADWRYFTESEKDVFKGFTDQVCWGRGGEGRVVHGYEKND